MRGSINACPLKAVNNMPLDMRTLPPMDVIAVRILPRGKTVQYDQSVGGDKTCAPNWWCESSPYSPQLIATVTINHCGALGFFIRMSVAAHIFIKNSKRTFLPAVRTWT